MCYLTGSRPAFQLMAAKSRIINAPAFATMGFATSRNPKKMSNRSFMESELKSNPEFFKAFPHL